VLAGSTLGTLAFWRQRHPRGAEEPPAGPDPAEELRAKLAASKAAAVEAPPAEPPAAEPPPPDTQAGPAAAAEPPEPSLDPDARRRSAHERARTAIEELGSSD
jgi:hypothetical protein